MDLNQLNSPLVVKVGGAAGIGGADLLDDLAERLPTGSVIVHGGSDRVTRLQEALGRPAVFLESPDGRLSRRTDREDLEMFCMATALSNRELVEALGRRGRGSIGISGLDGGLARARRKATVRAVVDGRMRVVRDQWTGRVESVDGEFLAQLVATGRTPVVAPLARGECGSMLNVDADRLAARVAVALGAGRLVLLTNVPGLLDLQAGGRLVERASEMELEHLSALAQGRMRAKVDAARTALLGGVATVVIADARRERPLTDALAGVGTVIRGASCEGVRS